MSLVGPPFPHVIRLVGVGIAAPCRSKRRVELATPLCCSTRRCLIPALASSTGGRWASYASMLFDMAVLGSASCRSTCGCWASGFLWRWALCRQPLYRRFAAPVVALSSRAAFVIVSPIATLAFFFIVVGFCSIILGFPRHAGIWRWGEFFTSWPYLRLTPHRWNPRCCYRRCQCRFRLGIAVIDFGAVTWFQTTPLGWYCHHWSPCSSRQSPPLDAVVGFPRSHRCS